MLWVVADVGQQDGGAVGLGEGHGLAVTVLGDDVLISFHEGALPDHQLAVLDLIQKGCDFGIRLTIFVVYFSAFAALPCSEKPQSTCAAPWNLSTISWA